MYAESLYHLCCKALLRSVDIVETIVHESSPFGQAILETVLMHAVQDRNSEAFFIHLLRKWPYQTLNLSGMTEIDTWWAYRISHSISSGCKHLNELDVSFCPIGQEGLKALIGILVPRETGVSNWNWIWPRVPKPPTSLKLPCLTLDLNVDIRNYDLVLQVLQQRPCLLKVKTFIADALKCEQILKLFNHMELDRLIKIDLNMNSLRNNGITAVCRKLINKVHDLRHLDLSYNVLNCSSENASEALKDFLGNQLELRYLDLSANRLGPYMNVVLGAIQSPFLSVLKLSMCGLNHLDFNMLTYLPCLAHLSELYVDGNNLRKYLREVKDLLKCLADSLSRLQKLNLSSGNIGLNELKELLPHLKNLKCLRELHVSSMEDNDVIWLYSSLTGMAIIAEDDD